jgi:hypothetical protein
VGQRRYEQLADRAWLQRRYVEQAIAVVTIVQQLREQRRPERESRPSVEQRLADLDELLRREGGARTECEVAGLASSRAPTAAAR